MITARLDYDSNMGGPIDLPDMITTFKHASDRLDEIKTMLNSINNPKQTKLIFQSLPKHMRRRAMSHNPKRLPRRYRQAHISQMKKSGLPDRSKRPSRKYRRKPSNLLKEYIRRQQKNVWLETHIWHAKRFHMSPLWGYKIAMSPTEKSYRACYRASARHCLVQDISYMGCIQISGEIDLLKQGFSKVTSSSCGLGICARAYIRGQREGSIVFFKSGCYPFDAIGRCQFMWNVNCVWIFAHPSFYKDLSTELISVFSLREYNVQSVDSNMKKSAVTFNIKVHRKFVRTPTFKNNETGITLVELKDTLSRFRLTGPLAQSVLSNAFKCATKGNNKKTPNWFDNYINENCNIQANESQHHFWSSLSSLDSPSQLSPGMILALNIEDPRINRPKTKTKSLPDRVKSASLIQEGLDYKIPIKSNISPIWEQSFRDKVIITKLETSEIDAKRNHQSIVPGERCSFENDMQPIPVLLIQRPGNKNAHKPSGFGCGWDVVIPGGYGMAVWLSLIAWGARPGGLKQTESIMRESAVIEFPPDTIGGEEAEERKSQQLRKTYFRLPPNKRTNYQKLAISSPFKSNWSFLIQEWNTTTSVYKESGRAFFVLRDLNILQQLNNCLHNRDQLNTINLTNLEHSLIPVHIKMVDRGSPDELSLICIPQSSDLHKKKSNLPCHIEPVVSDPHTGERQKLRKAHQALLKRMRRRRVRAKRKLQEKSEKKVPIEKPGTTDIVQNQYKKMCDLWVPEVVKTMRYQGTREVAGYMTQTDYSLTEGKFTGMGYVTLCGLTAVLQAGKSRKVLIRPTNSRNYRVAFLSIALE